MVKNELDFATLLRLPAIADEQKRKRVLQARIIGLGFGKVCGRCGGSGHYSFCPMYGTTCFGCGGTGFVAQKLTNKLFAELEPLILNGKLNEYLTELTKKTAIRRTAKTATARVMKAWEDSGVSKAYNWHNACKDRNPDYNERDAHIAHIINQPMYEAYNKVSTASQKLDDLQYRKPTNSTERLALDAERDALTIEVNTLTEAALTEIAALTITLKEYLEANPA